MLSAAAAIAVSNRFSSCAFNRATAALPGKSVIGPAAAIDFVIEDAVG